MLIFSILTYMVSAKLQIYLEGQLKNVNYSLANFGHIPYGRSLGGWVAKPLEFEEKQLDLCNISNVQMPKLPSNQTNKWLIGRLGNCSATTKAYVAQELGANLLMIISNKANVSKGIELNNDGMGFKIHIPVIEIGREDGEELIKELEDKQTGNHYGVISFKDSKKVEKPEVILFLALNNRGVFKFIREFQQYYTQLEKYVSFSISYDIEVQQRDERFGEQFSPEECLLDGKYCMQSGGENNGNLIIEEQMRQQCIWNSNVTQWFEYMDYFDKNCFTAKGYESCSKSSNIAKQQDIVDCIRKSYEEDAHKPIGAQDNTILKSWAQNKTLSGIVYFPGVLVNAQPFHGNLEADNVAEDICANMLDGTICTTLLQSEDDSPSSGSDINWAMIAFAVVSCLLFGLFLFMCYRRRLKMQMQQELGQQVNEMVSQYIKFYETKTEK